MKVLSYVLSLLENNDIELKYVEVVEGYAAVADLETRTIEVSKDLEHSEILPFYLLHELRHIIHYDFGYFKFYYKTNIDLLFSSQQRIAKYVYIGWCAEQDCDAFAHILLEQQSVSTFAYGVYPLKGVYGYDFLDKKGLRILQKYITKGIEINEKGKIIK